jgi:hypothetical protein
MIDADKLLYHYTTQEGLLGILQEGVIRASGIQHLNDASEFHYAVNIALSVLNSISMPAEVNERLTSILTTFQYSWDVFVTSFSQYGDQLGQWRAYGKDGGFSIGFDPTELRNLAVDQGYQLRKCQYDYHLQEVPIRDMVQRAVKTETWVPEDSFIFQQHFLELAPIFKHPSFAAEGEWRLSKLQAAPINGQLDKDIKYRPGKSFFVPYKEFKLTSESQLGPPLPIRMIVIGPTPHSRLSEWTVRNRLHILGLKPDVAPVRQSLVPYRAW